MRPVIKHEKVYLEGMSPRYFQELFESMPKDALYSMVSLDKKEVLECASLAILAFSSYYGALEAFLGLIPKENAILASFELSAITNGSGQYKGYGDTALDRLITYCRRLQAWYDARPTIPYGIYFYAQEKNFRQSCGFDRVYAETVEHTDYKLLINGRETDFHYKYAKANLT